VIATGGGVDFVSTGGVLTFATGVASRTIVVPIVDDSINESPETFTVTLSNPTGGAILGAPSVATVTITDNDPAGVVQFSRPSYAVVEDRDSELSARRQYGHRDGRLQPHPGAGHVDVCARRRHRHDHREHGQRHGHRGPGVDRAAALEPQRAAIGTPSTAQITLIDNQRPDLVISSLTGPAQGATGSAMTVVATVINQAGGMAPATTLGVFISSSSTSPGAGTRIGLVAIPALAGGASSTVVAPVSVPPGLAPGNYFLSAIADIVGVAVEERRVEQRPDLAGPGRHRFLSVVVASSEPPTAQLLHLVATAPVDTVVWKNALH
jgi:hypothetical protein